MGKKIMSYFLTLILIVVTLLTLALNIVNAKLLDENSVKERMEKLNIYDTVYQDLNTSFRSYTEQSGLEEEVLNDVITKEQVKNDVNGILDSIYQDKEYKIDATQLEQNLTTRIQESLKNANRTPNAREKEAIKTFVTTIGDVYENEVFPAKIISSASSYVVKVSELATMAEPIMYAVIAVLVLAIFAINFKEKSRFLSYMGISLMSSGVVLTVVDIFVKWKLNLQDISFLNSSISLLIQDLLQDVMTNVFTFGIIFIILGVIFSFIGNVIYKKQK